MLLRGLEMGYAQNQESPPYHSHPRVARVGRRADHTLPKEVLPQLGQRAWRLPHTGTGQQPSLRQQQVWNGKTASRAGG